jgi:hypothetical protein
MQTEFLKIVKTGEAVEGFPSKEEMANKTYQLASSKPFPKGQSSALGHGHCSVMAMAATLTSLLILAFH